LRQGVGAVSPQDFAARAEALAQARVLVLFGCGREGLMMRALAMRLHHLGLNVQMQGDMSCPPARPGDPFFTASGPGHLPTVAARHTNLA
jgi:6-phospho-3-hexuloisomerase